MSDPQPLRPARPDASPGASYGPKFPWKWVVLVLLGVGVGVVLWNVQSEGRLDARKQALLEAHAALGPAEAQYQQFRQRLETLIAEAATVTPRDWADERVRISELHQGDGLYLRVPRHSAADSEQLAERAKAMEADAIIRCLGIAPTSLRGFYEIGELLGDSFRERVEAAKDELVIEALERDLMRRTEQDLAALRTTMAADYLLLVLEHGETRGDGPVDVFLWSLRQGGDERVLEVRAEGNGLLVPARIDLPGLEVPRTRPLRDSSIADDCSIASQIKGVTGEQGTDFESSQVLDALRAPPEASEEPRGEAVPGSDRPREGP